MKFNKILLLSIILVIELFYGLYVIGDNTNLGSTISRIERSYFDRAGTTISPKTVGDNLDMGTGTVTAGDMAVTNNVTVADEVYGIAWNGVLEVPTKNALYDKIENLDLTGYVPYTGATTGVDLGSQTFTTTGNITAPKLIGGSATTSDLYLQTTSGVGETGADMHFLVGNNGATEAMTILNSGKVGIGTTAPGYKLHLYSGWGVSSEIKIEQNNGGGVFQAYRIGMPNSFFQIIDDTSSGKPVIMVYAWNTKYTSFVAGNVGIGTRAPTAQLHIDQSSTTGAKPVLTLDQADVSEELIKLIGTAASGTLTQSIVNAGDVGAFTTVGYIKVYIQDDGDQVADGAYYIPFGSLSAP